MQSAKGETIPFPAPIRTRDARGCVEKWLIEVEKNMINAVRDIIDGALETVATSSRCKHLEAFSTLVESLVQMTCIDFTIFLKWGESALLMLITDSELKKNREIKVLIRLFC